MVWVSRGIKLFKAITRDGKLLNFDQLKHRHDLPNLYYFWFLQLRLAFQAQFGDRSIESFPLDLENLLMSEELPKTLSVTYKELFKKRLKVRE